MRLCIVVSSVLVALFLPVACTPSTEDTCDRYLELRRADNRSADDATKSKCIERLSEVNERLKGKMSDAPKLIAQCIRNAGSSTTADGCPATQESIYIGEGGTKADFDAADARWAGGIVPDEQAQAKVLPQENPVDSPVDNMTWNDVKSRLSSQYVHYGYKMVSEQPIAGGWSGLLMLGDTQLVSSPIDVFKVSLIPQPSAEECFSFGKTLRSESRGDSRYECGNKQILFVSCQMHRDGGVTGPPTQECGSYNSMVARIFETLGFGG